MLKGQKLGMVRAPYGPKMVEWCPCDECLLDELCAHGMACEGFERWVGSESDSWRPPLGLCVSPSVEVWKRIFEEE